MAAAAPAARSGPLILDQILALNESRRGVPMALTPGRGRTSAVTLTGTYPRPDGFRRLEKTALSRPPGVPFRTRRSGPGASSAGHEVAEAPGVSLHYVSAREWDVAVEDRPAGDEGVKLSILAARVHGGRKIREQGMVECSARI